MNLRKLITTLLISTSSFANALEITTEFYPADKIPEEHKEAAKGSDCTIITLNDLPEDNVSIFEINPKHEKPKHFAILKTKPNVNFAYGVSAIGYIPGLEIKHIIECPQNNIMKEIAFVPNRNYAQSPTDGAEIEAVLFSIKPAFYKIILNGFDQNEKLEFKSVSYDESIDYTIDCCIPQLVIVTPDVKGKRGGIAKITIQRPSGEILKLDLPWGLEFLRYELYYDKNGNPKSYIHNPDFIKNCPDIADYFKDSTDCSSSTKKASQSNSKKRWLR